MELLDSILLSNCVSSQKSIILYHLAHYLLIYLMVIPMVGTIMVFVLVLLIWLESKIGG